MEFVKRTSVDCLAVAVGTAHGLYKDEQPELAFDLIAELRTVVPVPLVLHGASGTEMMKWRERFKLGLPRSICSVTCLLRVPEPLKRFSTAE